MIVITAYKLDPDDADLKPAVILEKPFHVAEIRSAIESLARRSQPPAEKEIA